MNKNFSAELIFRNFLFESWNLSYQEKKVTESQQLFTYVNWEINDCGLWRKNDFEF